jgi:hypothetical protein
VSGDDVAKRNRYMNVDPFVNNRIRLKVPEGHSDYINASPIKLEQSIPDLDQGGDAKIALHTEKETKNFIATQVCLSISFEADGDINSATGTKRRHTLSPMAHDIGRDIRPSRHSDVNPNPRIRTREMLSILSL